MLCRDSCACLPADWLALPSFDAVMLFGLARCALLLHESDLYFRNVKYFTDESVLISACGGRDETTED